jgi:ABC-type lipoprotein release transport system permease subunit
VSDLAQTGEGVSHVSLRLANADDSDRIAKELGDRLGASANVVTGAAEAAPIVKVNELRQKMLNLVAFAMFAMAATGIANTVLMAAYERTREIGTLRALGLDRSGVVGMFALEGIGMGIIGALLGGAAGGYLTRRWAESGIDLTAMLENRKGLENMPLSATLYVQFSIPTILAAMAAGVLVALLASLYPAWIASRLQPADAVRAE